MTDISFVDPRRWTLDLTGEGEGRGEDDMDPGAVDVEHDAEVDGYAAQHCKTVDEGPVGGIQRDLTGVRQRREQSKMKKFLTCTFIFKNF